MDNNEHRRTDAELAEARHRAQDRPFCEESARQWLLEIRDILSRAPPRYGLCWCSGTVPGEPVCRCAMGSVLVVSGRYIKVEGSTEDVRIIDLGSVFPEPS